MGGWDKSKVELIELREKDKKIIYFFVITSIILSIIILGFVIKTIYNHNTNPPLSNSLLNWSKCRYDMRDSCNWNNLVIAYQNSSYWEQEKLEPLLETSIKCVNERIEYCNKFFNMSDLK